jgi:hypothetical protein
MKQITIIFAFICLFATFPVFTQTTEGYIISGQTTSYTHGDFDFLLYRIDAWGNKQWRRNYGGQGKEWGGRLTEMRNSTFALAGSSEYSFEATGSDCIVYLLNDAGKIIWRRTTGPVVNTRNGAASIDRTNEGGFIVCGHTDIFFPTQSTNGLIAKLDGNGDTGWWHVVPTTFEPSNEEYSSIQQTADGGYIANVRRFGDESLCIHKLDENGYRIWEKQMGGAGQDRSVITLQTVDGGYVVGGSSTSFTHGTWDFLVYKLNSTGKKLWRKNYGGLSVDLLECLDITSDGGFILAGYSYSYTNGLSDMLVYKIDAAGRKQWRKNYGGTSVEIAYAVDQTADGGYILIGETWTYTNGSTDILVYKLAANGAKQWRKNYGGSSLDQGHDVIEITR